VIWINPKFCHRSSFLHISVNNLKKYRLLVATAPRRTTCFCLCTPVTGNPSIHGGCDCGPTVVPVLQRTFAVCHSKLAREDVLTVNLALEYLKLLLTTSKVSFIKLRGSIDIPQRTHVVRRGRTSLWENHHHDILQPDATSHEGPCTSGRGGLMPRCRSRCFCATASEGVVNCFFQQRPIPNFHSQ
jgi:hypothetical protein